jgi:hypothetical protein
MNALIIIVLSLLLVPAPESRRLDIPFAQQKKMDTIWDRFNKLLKLRSEIAEQGGDCSYDVVMKQYVNMLDDQMKQREAKLREANEKRLKEKNQ